MDTQDIFTTVARIAEKYGTATGINLKKGRGTIFYHKISEGSAISQEITETLPKNLDYTIKMFPANQRLEFTITPELELRSPCINGMTG